MGLGLRYTGKVESCEIGPHLRVSLHIGGVTRDSLDVFFIPVSLHVCSSLELISMHDFAFAVLFNIHIHIVIITIICSNLHSLLFPFTSSTS